MSSPHHHHPTPPPTIPDAPISADDNNADETLPLPLSASLVLTSLPQDAHQALEQAAQEAAGGGGKGGIPERVTIRFSPVGSAPPLRQKVYKVSSHNKFSFIVSFLAKKLASTATTEKGEGGRVIQQQQMQVFCYVNSVFAPGLDEGLGALWKCFKTDDTLIVAYSTTPAFG